MQLDKVNMSTIWAMLMGTVAAVVYMFSNFVSASDFGDYIVEDYYDKYYDMEDDLEDEADDDDIRRLKRNMVRLKAKICEIEPEWEECG